jgi:chemotaxis protein histidine kinase CheA
VQARVITVALSVVLVFAAHFDAIRLFQSLSSDGQVRAQLANSADALVREAQQLPHAKEGSRTVVPEVYRSAMAAVLEVAPPPSEQAKSKARHSSHGSAAPSAAEAEQTSSNGSAPNEIQIAATAPQSPEGVPQATPAVAQSSAETPAKPHKSRSAKQSKAKAPEKEREKPVAVSGEDKAAIEAKSTALKALETQPGFASREDADLWLRETLHGDPAAENLAAAYEQEVNSQLAGDADRLIDHSASIKRELARTRLQLIPDSWPGSIPSQRELPGLLIAVALLSLGASLCYNLLKGVASLRPLRNIK